MKYFKDNQNQVYAYESDGSQDAYIKPDLTPISETEAMELANPPPTAEQLASQIRAERDAKLQASDWTQGADSPVDKEAWATYRQALRDITDQETFPESVIWPEVPQ